MRGASLTRRVRFHATHRYHRPEWDEAKNRAVFGPCAAPEPHGHDYACDVTVSGEIDPQTGMVLDLGALDRILDERVVQPFHGRSLNDATPEFRAGGRIPTCEEVARLIASRVALALAALAAAGSGRNGVRVVCVRVAEDDTLSATWTEPA
jgi:6-pyruvoyltetrahydropterin/6-carboxytetrahydropterin synthase